ncbi:amiloride-sensitive sodium channel subunit alpha-like [Stegodyphus dumicola]|uniref:amiloride-sensitive sodium channel subunit alpha-like n=1 Tax=Stegodyphus dumicola TaxID=202533 RepID=UPI0015B263AF|nr:amiloride-sensitive sodium channel subunit alpha-like [Stegodyphus dumicola]
MHTSQIPKADSWSTVSSVSSQSDETSFASRIHVKFRLGSEEDSPSDISYSERIKCEVDQLSHSVSPKKHRFKEKVKEIIRHKKSSAKDEEDEIINAKNIREVTEKLLRKSSVYAVSQVGHSKSPIRKILWVLVLIAGLLGCSYQIYRFLSLYFQYPVVVNLEIENKWSLSFPAVTLCNLNRMKKKHQRCMENNKSLENCQGGYGTATASGSSISISEGRAISSCSQLFTGTYDSTRTELMGFLAKYSGMSEEKRKAFGSQPEDFIQSCSFNGELCSAADFKSFSNLKYGNCFMFNRVNESQEKVLKTSAIGSRSGLEVILDLDLHEYLPVTSSVGSRVIIHDPKEDPTPEEDGINISPGFETALSLKQSAIKRLPYPYRDNCADYMSPNNPYGSSVSNCVRSCIQKQNFAECACVDPTLAYANEYKHCNMTDKTDSCCLDNVLDSLVSEGLPCECPLPCFSLNYDIRSSTAVWPSEAAYFKYKTGIKQEDLIHLNSYRKGLAKLKVFYSTLQRSTYEQKPMFEDSELFSHLGGELGLWLGLSLVAVFELVENLLYLCKYFIAKSTASRNPHQ